MSWVIRLMETVAGVPTEFDGQYVVAYDPTWKRPDGSYDGGILEVTKNPHEALHFESMEGAVSKYRQPFGRRPDGLPNRPLTAWTVEIFPHGPEEQP